MLNYITNIYFTINKIIKYEKKQLTNQHFLTLLLFEKYLTFSKVSNQLYFAILLLKKYSALD